MITPIWIHQGNKNDTILGEAWWANEEYVVPVKQYLPTLLEEQGVTYIRNSLKSTFRAVNFNVRTVGVQLHQIITIGSLAPYILQMLLLPPLRFGRPSLLYVSFCTCPIESTYFTYLLPQLGVRGWATLVFVHVHIEYGMRIFASTVSGPRLWGWATQPRRDDIIHKGLTFQSYVDGKFGKLTIELKVYPLDTGVTRV